MTRYVVPRETTILAIQGAHPQRSRTSTRLLAWVRAAGLVAIIGYGILGAWRGVAAQRIGLPAGEVDCRYRITLIRDRVVALTQRSPQQSLHDPQDDVVSTLIRETLAACPDPDAQHALQSIAERLHALLRNRAQEAQARRELIAL